MLLLVPVVTVGTSLASNWDELVAAVGPIVQGGLPEPPGWLQSLPFSRLAGRIVAAAPRTGRGGREEGSILGGLGRVLDGDNS